MVTASSVYDAQLDTPVGNRLLLSRLAWPVRFFAAGVGLIDEPTFGDVVVRRIDDDAEVLRIPAGGSEETAYELATIREQLADLTAEEFRDRWGIAAA